MSVHQLPALPVLQTLFQAPHPTESLPARTAILLIAGAMASLTLTLAFIWFKARGWH